MHTIEERWRMFRLRAIALDAPPVQVHEMRIAFYAGFQAMLDANFELGGLDEHIAVPLLERLHVEARTFGHSLT